MGRALAVFSAALAWGAGSGQAAGRALPLRASAAASRLAAPFGVAPTPFTAPSLPSFAQEPAALPGQDALALVAAGPEAAFPTLSLASPAVEPTVPVAARALPASEAEGAPPPPPAEEDGPLAALEDLTRDIARSQGAEAPLLNAWWVGAPRRSDGVGQGLAPLPEGRRAPGRSALQPAPARATAAPATSAAALAPAFAPILAASSGASWKIAVSLAAAFALLWAAVKARRAWARLSRAGKAAVVAGLLLLAAGAGYHWARPLFAPSPAAVLASVHKGDVLNGEAVAVLDGDTLEILYKGVPLRVRLAHIDAPEKGQPFGDAAKRLTSRLAFGRDVQVRVTGKDRYGRLVAEITLPDGRSLNRELVEEGLAWWYAAYSKDRSYQILETRARRERRGLWAERNPVPPWKWRAERRPAVRAPHKTALLPLPPRAQGPSP